MNTQRSLAAWLAAWLFVACSVEEPRLEVTNFDLGEDLDLHDWCTPAIGPELHSFSSDGAEWTMGPCGHLVSDGESATLIHPDGVREDLTGVVGTPVFSPTGHLLAWTDANQVRLRHLQTGEIRMIETPSSATIGFVPSTDPEIGAWLWTCTDELRAWTLDADQTLGLAKSEFGGVPPDCRHVVASSGSPMLAFPIDDAIHVANLDTGEINEIAHGFVDHTPSEFGEVVWVDHDGRVVIHHRYDWVYDGTDFLAYSEIEARIHLADGTLLGSYEPYAVVHQAARRGAPVFIQHQHGLSVVFDDAGSVRLTELPLNGSPYQVHLTRAGDLLALDQQQVHLYTYEDPTTPIELDTMSVSLSGAEFVDPLGVDISPDGEIVYVYDNTGEGSSKHFAWSADEGLREAWVESWGPDAVSNAGTALVFTGPDPIDESLPASHSLIVELDGAVWADLGPVRLGAIVWLNEAQLVVYLWGDNVVDLGLVDFEQGTLEVYAKDFDPPFPNPYGPDPLPVQFDGLGERLAFEPTPGFVSWGVP